MSDLANSCEYLNIDKICTVFSDNPKAKNNRQLKCKNAQNITSCCYLCLSKLQCTISCKYLEQSENYAQPQQYETEKNMSMHVTNERKVETLQLVNIPVAFCFSCNTEMAWAKTQFTVDNWKGNTASILTGDKVLPVTVFLCPQCGKIEFKATDVIRKEEM